MDGPGPPISGDRKTEEWWRDYLSSPDSMQRFGRHAFNRLPSSPRCQLCAAPFAGPGGALMRAFGKRPAEGNPNMCNSCQKVLLRYHGGAEVEGSLLFADVRGSTALAERITPSEYRVLLDRFYSVASAQVFAHDGIVDKFVGDELVAAFPPYLGERHAERAVATATALLKATGHGGTEPPWIPVGAGVHTGAMWFGAIGEGSHTEITVIGDTVNVTARLASLAQAGEVLVSAAAADAAGLDPSLPRGMRELKGRQAAIEVVTLQI